MLRVESPLWNMEGYVIFLCGWSGLNGSSISNLRSGADVEAAEADWSIDWWSAIMSVQDGQVIVDVQEELGVLLEPLLATLRDLPPTSPSRLRSEAGPPLFGFLPRGFLNVGSSAGSYPSSSRCKSQK